MAVSIQSGSPKNSRHINSLAIFLSVLSLSHSVLASDESTDDYPSGTSTFSTPEECVRECIANVSKTCYYQFTVEVYAAYGGACNLCTPNNTGVINKCECVPADGVERSVLSVNRRIPGPSIEVCLGDKVIVDVTNLLPGMELTIHWHGLFQHTTPYFDGVPMVTQCPISQGNVFRYLWYAENSGTHFWHAHTGLQEMDGIFGPLIIREPRTTNICYDLYDHDLSEHVIIVNDWRHEHSIERYPGTIVREPRQRATAVLINGMGQYTDPDTGKVTKTSLAEFSVTQGQRYRFRFITSFATVCWSIFSIQGHSLTIIALDGEPIQPVIVDTIISYAGERFDFVINANQTSGVYWIQLRAGGECSETKIQQLGILRYDEKCGDPFSTAPTYDNGLTTGVVVNPTDGLCNETREDAICISHMKRAGFVDTAIFTNDSDYRFYLGFKFYFYKTSDIYKPGTYKTFLQNEKPLLSVINNISYVDAPSPPLSQYDDLPADQFCSEDNFPADSETPCTCTHTLEVPDVGSIVELIVVDEVGIKDLMHPFHLHGHSFYVMAMGTLGDNRKITAERVRKLDEQGRISRNSDYPAAKDTVPIPTNGYVILRFRANNPGWWIMHCHFVFHMVVGMDFLVHIGNSTDLPPVPKNFPTCGNYLPEPNYGQAWVDSSYWH